MTFTCTVIVQVLKITELFQLVELYLGNILKWQATQWWYWLERLIIVDVSVCQDRALWFSRTLCGRLWNGNLLVTVGKTLYMVIVQAFWEKGTLQVCRVILGRWSWNGEILCCDTGEIICTVNVQVSQDTEPFDMVELILRGHLEITDHLMVTQGEETLQSHCRCLPEQNSSIQ